MFKSILVLSTALLILSFNLTAQNHHKKKSIETSSLTTFTFNYQKGKYDKGITKRKLFNFDIIHRGNESFITRSRGIKGKKKAMIRVKKTHCEFGDHDSYYSHKLKTRICFNNKYIFIHFAEHFDKPAEVRVYTSELENNDLDHPLSLAK